MDFNGNSPFYITLCHKHLELHNFQQVDAAIWFAQVLFHFITQLYNQPLSTSQPHSLTTHSNLPPLLFAHMQNFFPKFFEMK